MNLAEIKSKVIEYFYTKNIDLYMDEHGDLIWYYKYHYTEFKITCYITSWNFNTPTFKFYANYSVNDLIKKRVKISEYNNAYLNKIYKILLYVKSELDKIGDEQKKETDLKRKYATELELYYNRKHKRVTINSSAYKDSVNISVYGYNNDEHTTYNIEAVDKKYFLRYKSKHLKKVIKMAPLK